MTKAEYQEYFSKVNTVKEHSRQLVRSVDPEKLNLSYGMGKQIDIARQQILHDLDTIGVFQIKLRSKETLADDIRFEELIGDESQTLAALAYDLCDGEMANEAMKQSIEFLNLIPPLRKHVWSYAERLEADVSSKH